MICRWKKPAELVKLFAGKDIDDGFAPELAWSAVIPVALRPLTGHRRHHKARHHSLILQEMKACSVLHMP